MTTDTLTLAAFLGARLDEDEATARAIHADHCETPADVTLDSMGRPLEPTCDCDWHVARVLAEVAAKRRIVEEHDGRHQCTAMIDRTTPEPRHCPSLTALAAIYADHEDYRTEWEWAL